MFRPPHRKQPRARTPGTYDDRETDSWALGVVLFVLVTCPLPVDHSLMLDVLPADVDAERARRRWVMGVFRGKQAWPAPVGEREPDFYFVELATQIWSRPDP